MASSRHNKMNNKEVSSFLGQVLFVDLGSETYYYKSSFPYFVDFLGGVGINDWILFTETSPYCGPLSPDNLLIFGTGPLSGTLAPGGSRLMVTTKNCATKGIAYSSAGGKFAPAMKFAGIDCIVIKGKARQPIYLHIRDKQVKFCNASHLWGKYTNETAYLIKQELNSPRVTVAAIGPAGENMVQGAAIILDGRRSASRCGVGTVMGAKKLKAIAVEGSGKVEVADPKRFMGFVRSAWKKIEKSQVAKDLKKEGTYGLIPLQNEVSFNPARNFQDAAMAPEKMINLRPDFFHKFETGSLSCDSCPIACGKVYEITEGPYARCICWGIQAGSLWDFGTRLDIDSAAFVIKAHSMCNQLGLDLNTVSPSIAWLFECFEKGILTAQDTEGLNLTWGNYKAVEKLIEDIAYRRGLGKIVADGLQKGAKLLGKNSEKYVSSVKGQVLDEPLRAMIGWALGCMVDSRGGTHMRGAPITEFSPAWSNEVAEAIIGVPNACSPQIYEGKAALVVYHERLKVIIDALGVCYYISRYFTPDLISLDDYKNLLNSATGANFTKSDLLLIGERIINVEKAFNTLHARFSRNDDVPPRRFLEEKIKSGKYKGVKIDRARWEKMLDEYYKLHNWDVRTGLQTTKCLEQLGLEKVANTLKKYGLLVS